MFIYCHNIYESCAISFLFVIMDTTRCKVIVIMLQTLFLGHITYVILLAVLYLLFQYMTCTLSINFIEASLVKIFQYIQGEHTTYGFVYYCCLCVGISMWVYVTFKVSNYTLDRLFHHCVTRNNKSFIWQVSLYILIKLYREDFELHYCYFAFNIFVFWFLFGAKEMYNETYMGQKKTFCILVFTLLRMYCYDWDLHWIIFSTCFAIADELEYIINTTIFFYETFLPTLYTTSVKHMKNVLNQDLQWANRIIGEPEKDSRKRVQRIMHVYTNIFVQRKTPLHAAYEYSKDKIRAHLLLVHQPYHNPNCCDSNSRVPLWYKIKECCNFYGRGRQLPLQRREFRMRHSNFVDT